MNWTRFLVGVGVALCALAAVAPADAHAGDKVLALRTDGTAFKGPERAAVDAAIAAKLKLSKDIEQVAAPEADLTDMMIDLECIDLDGDCRVGITDLLAVLAAWGPCPDCPEDLDGDGQAGLLDLLRLLADWD